MNLYDKSSLILVPGAVKDGKIYSQRPENGDGDFTFTRASSATRVDENGLIEKGRENLLLQSNQFDTTWYNTTSSETGGQIGYDGSNDAWELSISAAAGRLTQLISLGGVQTFSVYAKAGTYNFLDLYAIGNVAHSAYFDLSTGSVGTTFSLIDSSITSVGNGWYKCSITFSDATLNVRFYPAVADNDLTGTSGSIYIQNAQLEQGLVATDYIESTTTTAVSGITEDLPRLDYSGGASCPSLLLEPTRTNQVQNSEYYELYTLSRVSISSNATTSPEGLQNATELIEDSSNENHFFRIPNLSWTSGTDVVFSIYLKENTRRYARLRFDNTGYQTRAWLDLRTGETTFIDGGSENGVCTSVNYGNGWFKYDFKITAQNTGTGSVQVFTQSVESVTGSLQTTYQGDGTSGIYVWGAQVESNASYPTSYIPTYGSAVTRSEDSCFKTSATSLIGQSEGSFYIEINIDKLSLENRFILTLSNLAQSEGFFVRHRSSNELQFYSFGLTNNFDFRESIISGGTYKLAGAYKSGDVVFYVNGVQINADTTIFSTPDLSVIRLGRSLSSATLLGGGINQALLFKTRLSNEELADLTTL